MFIFVIVTFVHYMWLDTIKVYMGHTVSKGESVTIAAGSMAAGRKVWHWGSG